MHRQPVASSTIASIGYDPDTETLEVEFLSGAVYQYYNFPQGTYDAFVAAPSKGQFLHYEIRDGYPYSRI